MHFNVHDKMMDFIKNMYIINAQNLFLRMHRVLKFKNRKPFGFHILA